MLMNLLPSLLLLTAMLVPTPALVLKSGARIAVDDGIKVESGVVYFRSGGSLYSIPSSEVDLEATRSAANAVAADVVDSKKLRVTPEERERLLRDLEQNHSGTAATQEQMTVPPPAAPTSSDAAKGDEWGWKKAAQAHEEDVRRAKENLDLLRERVAELRSKISGFISQGYKPSQFSYDTTMLANYEDQIPQAELEVQRAERSQQQFLEEARRKGILPGWLR